MNTLTVFDESMHGESLGTITFEISTEQITVHELIRSRVFQETKDANARHASRFANEPIAPLTETEVALNGPAIEKPDPVDWQCEFEKAIHAFRSNQILVFVNDQQMKSLDDVILIDALTKVRFLRLTMLMGG